MAKKPGIFRRIMGATPPDGEDEAQIPADTQQDPVPNDGFDADGNPAPTEGDNPPPADTGEGEGVPSDGDTGPAGEGNPPPTGDSGDGGTPPSEDGAGDPPPTETEGDDPPPADTGVQQDAAVTVMYAITDKESGTITGVKSPSAYENALTGAVEAFLQKEGIKPSPQDLQALSFQIMANLSTMGYHRLTVGKFLGNEFVGEVADGPLKDAMLEDYEQSKAEVRAEASRENDLKSALEELERLDPAKMAQIADLMSVKPKSGVKPKPNDFVHQIKGKKQRAVLLGLVTDEINRLSQLTP